MSATLSAPTIADQDDFLEAVAASHALHHPWFSAPATPDDFATYLARVAQDNHYGYLVRDDATGRLAGYINASNIVLGAFRSTYLGYAAFAAGAGRGLMTAGLSLVLDDVFGRLDLHRAEANIQPGNERSIALVKRLGFRLEGFSPDYLFIDGAWRDHQRFAITSDMWANR
jgi:[ribosomal protein S5]-alanine N-acetyltransferase